jgi:3'-5' exoribonuclease
MSDQPPITPLSDAEPGQQADCFVVLAAKDRAKTRDGKPYFRVSFRDAARKATAMIWNDTRWFADCESAWQAGGFYKIRCRYEENQYGPQIDLLQIREVTDDDAADGFDPADFFVTTRFDPQEMFAELLDIVDEHITDEPLKQLVVNLLKDNEAQIKDSAAAVRNHHAFRGGFLEHVLSVTRTCQYLADKYLAYYPETDPPLSKSLVVAGGILHDIGKLRELESQPQGFAYTAEGRLVGHILLGRDIVREYASAIDELDAETLLRLEHIIIAHQNLPEWGSPIAPHTPESLLVHYADDIDAKYHMMATALELPPEEGEEFTPRDNPLRRAIFRGLNDTQT